MHLPNTPQGQMQPRVIKQSIMDGVHNFIELNGKPWIMDGVNKTNVLG